MNSNMQTDAQNESSLVSNGGERHHILQEIEDFFLGIRDVLHTTDLTKIPGVEGQQHLYYQDGYEKTNKQYATDSEDHAHAMDPGLIVAPNNVKDIALTLQYAREKRRAVAVRSGGHQYSGASSTDRHNILLDLRNTFKGEISQETNLSSRGNPIVRTSVSTSLRDMNAWLGGHGWFVPHGQCEGVFTGGHVQSGGYGQLGRSFGLFGDHVVSIEICNPDDPPEYMRKLVKGNADDAELFNAILGGSPGNFGILTHFSIEVHKNEDYEGCEGLWALFHYSDKTLSRLLKELVKMSDDKDKPRNFDFCVSALSGGIKPYATWDDLIYVLEQQKQDHDWKLRWPINAIVVYAQWVPFSSSDKFDHSWFDNLKKGALFSKDTVEIGRSDPAKKPKMSDLTKWWIFQYEREFELPYIKRTYTTNSTTLGADGWADWVTGRIHEQITDLSNGCYLSCQLQGFGGNNSMFTKNVPEDKPYDTSYSWRDTTMVATLDCFYRPPSHLLRRSKGPYAATLKWQFENDLGMGPGGAGKFTDQDRRVLWGSYFRFEDPRQFDMTNVWQCYYDNEEKYKKLQALRAKYDPDGLYTPNTFCVQKPARLLE